MVVSVAALAVAPAFMPAGYDWVRHTTSESAAQGLAGAWVARLGFVAFGLAVLWLAAAAARSWGRGAVWMHAAFGACREWCGKRRVLGRPGADGGVGSEAADPFPAPEPRRRTRGTRALRAPLPRSEQPWP